MLDSMFAPQEKIEYVVAFQVNPEYTGDYQVDKWLDKDTGQPVTNIYGKFRTPKLARDGAAKCIAWCSDEPYPTYTEDSRGHSTTEWRTRHHDNIIVKIYKFVNGENTKEEIPLCESDDKTANKNKVKKELQPA